MSDKIQEMLKRAAQQKGQSIAVPQGAIRQEPVFDDRNIVDEGIKELLKGSRFIPGQATSIQLVYTMRDMLRVLNQIDTKLDPKDK